MLLFLLSQFCYGLRGIKEGLKHLRTVGYDVSCVVVNSLSGNLCIPFLSTCDSDAAHQWCPGEWPLCSDHHCRFCWFGKFGFPSASSIAALASIESPLTSAGSSVNGLHCPKAKGQDRQCWIQPLKLFWSLCVSVNELSCLWEASKLFLLTNKADQIL